MNSRGNIISELRREAGYTQKTLAEALNITDKAVSKWERGICLPDVSLLPRLSLLLGVDIELLLSKNENPPFAERIGLLDFQNNPFDLSQIIYDKPAVYYLLSHFLLLGITDIHIRTTKENETYLRSEVFSELGFTFTFDFSELSKAGLMIMNKPCFLFGSDLTRLFQGAMATRTILKANPMNSPVPFLFCPPEYSFLYLKNPDVLYETAAERNFGRGMICMEMGSPDVNCEISAFVKTYQNHTGLLIGSLEEIAYRKKILSYEKLCSLAEGKPYRELLLHSLSAEKNK